LFKNRTEQSADLPAEDDDGAAGLRPPVGVYLDWRHGGASQGSWTGFRFRVSHKALGVGALQPPLFRCSFGQKKTETKALVLIKNQKLQHSLSTSNFTIYV